MRQISPTFLTSHHSGRYGHEEMPHHPLEQPERTNHPLTNLNRKQKYATISPPPFPRHRAPSILYMYRPSIAIDCFASVPLHPPCSREPRLDHPSGREARGFDSRVNISSRVLSASRKRASDSYRECTSGCSAGLMSRRRSQSLLWACDSDDGESDAPCRVEATEDG